MLDIDWSSLLTRVAFSAFLAKQAIYFIYLCSFVRNEPIGSTTRLSDNRKKACVKMTVKACFSTAGSEPEPMCITTPKHSKYVAVCLVHFGPKTFAVLVFQCSSSCPSVWIHPLFLCLISRSQYTFLCFALTLSLLSTIKAQYYIKYNGTVASHEYVLMTHF